MLKQLANVIVDRIPRGVVGAIPPQVKEPLKQVLGRRAAPPAPPIEPPSQPASALVRVELPPEVAAIRWFHTIDLGNGVITPGREDTIGKLPRFNLPESLAGKSVLDIGAWDGYYSFVAEQRGARRVLATDSYVWAGKTWGSKAGFDLAKRKLNSRVEERHIDVTELSPRTVGVFDVVLFLGVIYHMRDPLAALERVASVTGDMLVLESETDFSPMDAPAFYFRPNYIGDESNWWIPSRAGLVAMVQHVGFKTTRIVSEVQLPESTAGRIVLHAWK